MALYLGDEVPNFTAETTQGPIEFHKWLGNGWAVLFSHPSDFTPICTTEIGTASRLKSEWESRKVKIIGLSVNDLVYHQRWIQDINRTQGTQVNFPLIADPERKVANLYGMIPPNAKDNTTVRSTFIIGPDKKIKLIITYPAATGRNFDEILRTIDSLQLTAQYTVGTPADWKNGEDCIILPSVKDEEIPRKFPKGHKVILPYLRTTPQPNR